MGGVSSLFFTFFLAPAIDSASGPTGHGSRGLPLDFVVLWIGGGGVALGVCGFVRST